MKISCDQKKLIKALNTVSKAVTSRTTIPILKGILIEADKDNQLITLSASDLEISIETVIDATVIEEGSLIVTAKLFNDIVRKLPAGEILFEIKDEKNLEIKAGNSEFNIVGLFSDEFPKITESGNGKKIVLNKNILKDMIRKTCFAASIDESRGIIVGTLIELQKESLNMVALDGFRMAIVRENIKSEEDENIVIAARILFEIGKVLSEYEEEEDVDLTLDDKKAIFSIKNTKIVARLLDGEFIKYRDILPKENKIKVRVNKNFLQESIERASIIIKEGSNNFLKFNIADERILITSRSEEGDTREEVKATIEGEDLEIGFNARFVMDTLKAVSDEEIIMEYNTGVSPCLIKPVEGNKFEYLVLPVRLQN